MKLRLIFECSEEDLTAALLGGGPTPNLETAASIAERAVELGVDVSEVSFGREAAG